ncbi:prepilin-type N-terminal cleavage/methylation domain-containing protein [Massilia sp. CFBP9012]|uniref:prepilin-type N-terminal cleavage/methylation domain-containing protein n=1 Tax=Massilia sp. CFBP9012 TaxID=3096531 RepID=UPI002A6B848F|nr:prepilin-type N-terminal cleavage/methylation domain-containing protein [Massilia sp. CFBP9012]MDY0975857.1 prepilin-type N-terminal cleavage/methylation domain-containing protein [Massilia sp. CFBP9012]
MLIKRMSGVTLVELIVAIVIVGTALAGLVAVYNRVNTASADPLLTQQKLAIAESMMEEVMQKPFAVGGPATNDRRFFDDVRDYNNYGPAAISNVNGDAVQGLERYRVAVTVASPGAQGVPPIQGIPQGEALRIRVAVTVAGDQPDPVPVILTGWRTQP